VASRNRSLNLGWDFRTPRGPNLVRVRMLQNLIPYRQECDAHHGDLNRSSVSVQWELAMNPVRGHKTTGGSEMPRKRRCTQAPVRNIRQTYCWFREARGFGSPLDCHDRDPISSIAVWGTGGRVGRERLRNSRAPVTPTGAICIVSKKRCRVSPFFSRISLGRF
jgi:hypothetical protein